MDNIPTIPRRWDPIVKLTHWGVVAAVIGNAIFTEEGSGWHIWVGYGLAALLALRLLWGLIGPAEARFSAFAPSLSRAAGHLGDIRRGEVREHRSHNPLGALMAYAIWATLLVISGTGIAMSGPPPADPAAVRGHEGGEKGERSERGEADETAAEEAAAPQISAATNRRGESVAQERGEREQASERGEFREPGPAVALPAKVGNPTAALARPALADHERGEAGESREGGESEEDEALAEVHEIAVNLLYVLIALHIAGVVFETRRSGPQIVRAMVPGGTPRG